VGGCSREVEPAIAIAIAIAIGLALTLVTTDSILLGRGLLLRLALLLVFLVEQGLATGFSLVAVYRKSGDIKPYIIL
jgi:hypothetical protein